MALSNKEKQKALRERRAKLGLKRKEFWVTLEEFEKLKQFLSDLRKSE